MSTEPVWDEDLCRRYTEGMRRLSRYDHRGVAAKVARHLANLSPHPTVVEVASGPGFLAFELARLLSEPALVLVDSSPVMLQIAVEEATRSGLTVRSVESSAQRIELADASAQVVLCKNLMNCIDTSLRVEVVQEMARLLVPGGHAFVIDFDLDGSRLAAWLIGLFARAQAGAQFHRDFADAFSRRLDPGPLAAAFAAAGCTALIERFGPTFMIVARRAE